MNAHTAAAGCGDNEFVQQCEFCYDEGGLENGLSDGHITQEQFDSQLADLKKQHGR